MLFAENGRGIFALSCFSIFGHIFRHLFLYFLIALFIMIVTYIFPQGRGCIRMHSFGIFTSRLSLERVMDIDSELTRYGMVTYLPYTSPDHLKFCMNKTEIASTPFCSAAHIPLRLSLAPLAPFKSPVPISMFQTGTITR